MSAALCLLDHVMKITWGTGEIVYQGWWGTHVSTSFMFTCNFIPVVLWNSSLVQSNPLITSTKGLNKLWHSARCVVKLKKKCFKTNYRPTGVLLNVNALVCSNLKLYLKSRNNKCYFPVIVNFCSGLW